MRTFGVAVAAIIASEDSLVMALGEGSKSIKQECMKLSKRVGTPAGSNEITFDTGSWLIEQEIDPHYQWYAYRECYEEGQENLSGF